MSNEAKMIFLRKVVSPKKISDVRLTDMIDDIGRQLKSSAEAFKPYS